MTEINAGVRLSLRDQFSSGIRNAGQSVREFGSKALGAAEKANKAFSGLAGTLATVGITIGAGAALRTFINLDDRIVRIGTDIGATAEQTNELRRALYRVAQDPSIKMGTDSLLSAMETFASRSFDTDFIMESLRDVGIAMKATGASGEEMANFFIESYKRGMSREEITRSLDDMAVIGDRLRNRFSISAFTNALPGLEAVNALLGQSAMSTTELFTTMNILGAGTKSPARAVSAFTSIVNELADPRTQEALHRFGVEVRYSSGELQGQFRNLSGILEDIAATDMGTGNFDNLTMVFSGAAMDAIQAHNRFGRLADGLDDLGDTFGTLEQRASSNASSLRSNLTNLQTAFMGFADQRLTAPMERLTYHLNRLAENPERVERMFWGITAAVGALGAIRIGSGVISLLANLKGLKGSQVSLPSVSGGGVGVGGAGMPVHVTNWGGAPGSSMMPKHPAQNPAAGKPPGRPAAGTPLGKPAVNSAVLGRAGLAGGLMAAVVAVPQMVGELRGISENEEFSDRERNSARGGAIGQAVGSVGGAAAGALAGAAIGSVVPVVGTAIGALAGGLIGYFGGRGGRVIGERIGSAVTREEIPRTLQYEIQSTQALPGQTPASAVLEGNAAMDVRVSISDDRAHAEVYLRNNTMPMQVNTGLAMEARGMAL